MGRMDKKRALQAFEEYSKQYDREDIKIRLKVDHTYRVAELSAEIGGSVGADKDFAWLLGLLHDIGRFEQLTRYGTFVDRNSVDHAQLGADLLFSEGLIDRFAGADTVTVRNWKNVAETAVKLHNKLYLPDDLDEEALLYCRVLRDADKVDIFRVLTEPPYDERNERIVKGSADGTMAPAREDVMAYVYEHHSVPKFLERTEFESLVSQCCMAFELQYPVSRRIVAKQGYLAALMNPALKNDKMSSQMALLRGEMEKVWEEAG